jgi:hypothetical protein
MSIDPSDDCTFFYTNEYILTNGTWHTPHRVLQIHILRQHHARLHLVGVAVFANRSPREEHHLHRDGDPFEWI